MITNGYATQLEVKSHIAAVDGATFTAADDLIIDATINAVSRALDARFGTTFYAISGTRYRTARFSDWIAIPETLSISTLATDDDADATHETTWATSDYWLEPLDNDGATAPYKFLKIKPAGANVFPVGVANGVKIVGTFGRTTAANTPPQIRLYTILATHRLWKRKDAIFGVAGAPALGVQVVIAALKNDADLEMLLMGIPAADEL